MARSHAVVLGAGFAGLLAGRVLADSYEQVTLIERDEFPLRGDRRPGVPQDGQWHLLMPSTTDILEELHPGLLDELEAAHVPVLHHLSQTHLRVAGHELCRDGELPRPLYQPTRPLLEAHLRARTSTRVLMRPGVAARELLLDAGRVVGVLLDTPEGPERLAADLVVDATGGALALPGGLPRPEETRVEVGVRQVTVTLSVGTVPSAVEPLLMHGPDVNRPYGLAVARVGWGLWQLSAIGYRDHHPPVDRAGLLEFAEPLLPPHWWRMMAAHDWPEPAVFDFPASVWHRWDLIAEPPAGLVVVGDGLMRLNPAHAKGMILAARQATTLRDCLAQGDGDLPRRFYAAVGELLAKEWELCEGPDRLVVESADRELPAKTDKLLHKILTLAESDAELVQNLLRVQWGMADASALLSPTVVRKLVGGRFRLGLGRNRANQSVAS